MLETAWNDYRGWARRARQLQVDHRTWSRMAAGSAGLAAVLGAAAGSTGNTGAGRVLAFLAAACAAITPVLGQDTLSVGREAGWLRARAAAETIKSECMRFCAHVGEYAGAERKALFRRRCEQAIEAVAKTGLTPLADPLTDDPRRPSDDMILDWYLSHRVEEQRDYYAKVQANSERDAARQRAIALALSVVSAVLGAASATFNVAGLAPWIAVAGTLGGVLLARSAGERSQFLAANAAAMVSALERMKEAATEDGATLAALVGATETLLAGEHAAWSDRMHRLATQADEPATAAAG
jgi:SMODS and SLOG-associating 2TM effector domain 1/Protein of unknown function (DUF4231)